MTPRHSAVPLVWTLALAAVGALAGGERWSLRDAPALAAALLVALGFWTLFFASARRLHRTSRLTLLASAPLLLALLGLAAAQAAHRVLYGERFDPDRVRLVSENWELVTTEVFRLLAAAPPGLWLAAALALLAGFAWLLERSRAPVYRPLRGAGRLYAAASLLCLGWWLAPPLRALFEPASPALDAPLLVRDIAGVLDGERRKQHRRPRDWLLGREAQPHLAGRAGGPRPHILLVLLESVRADHLPVYGYARETTPNLADWAAQSDVVRFRLAFANATLSYFSMVSLTSGLDLRRDRDAFERSPLVWDRLAARGYDTCFVTLSLTYPRYRLDRFLATPGLRVYRDVGQEQLAAVPAGDPEGLRPRLVHAVLGEALFRSLGVDRDDALGLAAFRECLAARDRTRPFFGVWELESTHFPYRYPASFRTWQPASPYTFRRSDPTPLVNEYDNALRYTDHRIGELLAALEAEGLADETIVVVASDHGEAFFEHGRAFHGRGLQPEQTHVPLLVRIPRALRQRYPPAALAALEANARRPVQLADLAPTLAALADGGLEEPDPLESDGANLLRPLPPQREIHVLNEPPFRRRDGRPPRERGIVRDGALELLYRKGRAERFELSELAASRP